MPAGQTAPTDHGSEVVQIDGDRTPELIPQWAIWEQAFRLFGRGAKLLPPALRGRLSAAESSLLFAEAEAHLKCEAQLEDYTHRLRLLIARVKPDGLDQRLRDATLDYRRGVLRGRDRLLNALTPAAKRALFDFVESQKTAIKVTLRKADLAAFLLPE